MDFVINPSNHQKLKAAQTDKIKVPGDKSISHRAAILGALTGKEITIKGFSPGNDCFATLDCLQKLGVHWEKSEQTPYKGEREMAIKIFPGKLKEPEAVLDAKNSGTTARLLLGVLAGSNFFACLTGDHSLKQRPMDRIIQPLAEMGHTIKARAQNKLLPAAVLPDPTTQTPHTTAEKQAFKDKQPPLLHSRVASAQVKSSILLAGLTSGSGVTVIESQPTRDHTERMLAYLGSNISSFSFVNESVENITIKEQMPRNTTENHLDEQTQSTQVQLEAKQLDNLNSKPIDIPGDMSSAAFLISLAFIVPGMEITLKDTGLNPTRTGFLKVAEKFGGKFHIKNEHEQCGEPRGDITTGYTEALTGICMDKASIPGTIDELPLVAVLGTQAQGVTRVTGAKELRYKESDRIHAITTELKKMGAQIDPLEDGFQVSGPTKLKGATVHAHGDHRIAMALSVAAAAAEGTTTVKDAECIAISYPGFETHIQNLGIHAVMKK